MNAENFWIEHDNKIPSRPTDDYDSFQYSLYRGMPRWFNAFFDKSQSLAIHSLLKKACLDSNARIIDIGCGTGRWTARLIAKYHKYLGVDPGINALRYASSKHYHARFVNASLPMLPLSSSSQELALSVYVLQHIPFNLQFPSIKEISRVLQKDGYMIACESIYTADPSSHVFPNEYHEWRDLFSDLGFILIAEQGTEYIPYIKIFHFLRDKLRPSKPERLLDVTSIGQELDRRPWLSMIIRTLLALTYPIEWFCTRIFPAQWARSVCFLLKKA